MTVTPANGERGPEVFTPLGLAPLTIGAGGDAIRTHVAVYGDATDTFCCWRRRNGYACPCPQATGAALDAAVAVVDGVFSDVTVSGDVREHWAAVRERWARTVAPTAPDPTPPADPPTLRCGHPHFPATQPPSWLDDRCRDAIHSAWRDHYAPDPTARTEAPTALDLRKQAEQRLEQLLGDDAMSALAFHLLRKAGWDTDRATRVLKAAGWTL